MTWHTAAVTKCVPLRPCALLVHPIYLTHSLSPSPFGDNSRARPYEQSGRPTKPHKSEQYSTPPVSRKDTNVVKHFNVAHFHGCIKNLSLAQTPLPYHHTLLLNPIDVFDSHRKIEWHRHGRRHLWQAAFVHRIAWRSFCVVVSTESMQCRSMVNWREWRHL